MYAAIWPRFQTSFNLFKVCSLVTMARQLLPFSRGLATFRHSGCIIYLVQLGKCCGPVRLAALTGSQECPA